MDYRLFFLVCLYITVSAFSCDEGIQYDASIKYRVSGSVTDENGIPLEDIKISLIAFSDNLYQHWDNTSVSQAARTDFEGKFDFVVSDAGTLGSVLEVNYINENYNYTGESINSQFDTNQNFYIDDSYVDYEIEFDVVLHQSIPVHLSNSFNNRLAYRMRHNGVSDNDSISESYWIQMQSRDTVTYYLRPNQSLGITYFSPTSGNTKDTIVELGSEALLIQLDSI